MQISVRGSAGVVLVHNNQVRREQTHKGVSMEANNNNTVKNIGRHTDESIELRGFKCELG